MDIYKKTTTAGFEPTLPKGNCLAGNRLNHSATLSYTILQILLIHYYIYYSLPLSCLYTTKFFLKKKLSKRQWQDLNLRIQRIIDFKSIALDHSATLSYTDYHTSPYPIQQSDRHTTILYTILYTHTPLYTYITIPIYHYRNISL